MVIEPILECSVTGYYLISHRFLTEVKFLMKEYSVRFLVNNYSIFFLTNLNFTYYFNRT